MPDNVCTSWLTQRRSGDYAGPWPEPESRLRERFGWRGQNIAVVGPPRASTLPSLEDTLEEALATVEALVRGPFAVHRMVDDVGFTISIAHAGYRLSHGGRVFARSHDAMACCEVLDTLCGGWEDVPRLGFTQTQSQALRRLMDEAEHRGAVLEVRVYPS